MRFFTVLWVSWFISEIILSRLMRAGKSANRQDKSTLKVIWITIILSVTAGIFLSKTGFNLTSEYFGLIYWVAISLIILGLLVRWISIITLKKSFTVNVSTTEDQKIIQAGLYKYIRHPSYTGSLLSFLGLALIFNNGLTLLTIFIPISLAFLYRIQIEEKVLAKAFDSEYVEYIKNTGKLLPKIF